MEPPEPHGGAVWADDEDHRIDLRAEASEVLGHDRFATKLSSSP